MQDAGCMLQDARYGMPDMSPVALAKGDAGFRIGTWQLAVDKRQIVRAQGSGFSLFRFTFSFTLPCAMSRALS